MKNLIIATLLASTQAVQVKQMSAASSQMEMEQQAQWFLFDDVYNWLYCKYRECNYDQHNQPTAENT